MVFIKGKQEGQKEGITGDEEARVGVILFEDRERGHDSRHVGSL